MSGELALELLLVVGVWLALAALLGPAVGRLLARRAAPAPRLVRVHYADDDRSVEGILVELGPDHYALKHGRQYVDEATSVPLDGDTLIPRGKVLLIQDLGPGR